MTRYLVQKAGSDPADRTYYAVEIRQTVSWLMEEYKCETETERLEYTEALCTASARIRGSFSFLLFQHMTAADGIKLECPPNDVSQCAITALAYLGDISKLKILIDAGVDVNTGSRVMGRPLQAAAAGGHTEIVALLIKSGADLNLVESGYKALQRACLTGHDTVVRTLILEKSGYKALQLACFAGHEGVVRILLNPKYGIQTSGESYIIAVFASVRGDHVDLMQQLINFGGPKLFPRLRNEMLHEAAGHGAMRVVRWLLDQGADAGLRGNKWMTPIQGAASRGHIEIVRLLIARRAESDLGRSLSIYQAAERGYERVVQILLDAGDDINGNEQCGPLSGAVKWEKLQMIQYLLKQGIDLRANSTKKAFQIAARHGYDNIVRILAAYGVAVDSDDDDYCPMLSALMYGHDDVVKTLLELGAQPIEVSKCQFAAEFASGALPSRTEFIY